MSKRSKDNLPVQTAFTDEQREKMATLRTALHTNKVTKNIMSDQDLLRWLLDGFNLEFYLTNIHLLKNE
jgi:hypothetical protein